MDADGPPPAGGDRNRGASLLAMFWVEEALILLTIAARFWSRSKLRIRGLDDWIMGLTVCLVTGSTIAMTIAVQTGNGRHSYYLTAKQREKSLIAGEYVAQSFSVMAIATGKISVGFLILRIIGPMTVWRKWIVYILLPVVLILNSLSIIFLFVQCSPKPVLWEGKEKHPWAKCWNPSTLTDWNIFVGSFNAFADVLLGILPLTFIWALKLPVSKKLALSILLGCGIFAGICAAVKTSYMGQLSDRSDFLWETYDLNAWTGAENLVIIVCGSVPTFKPVWDYVPTTIYYVSHGRWGKPPLSQRLSLASQEKRRTWSMPWAQPGSNRFVGSTVVSCENVHRSDEFLGLEQGINVEQEVDIRSDLLYPTRPSPVAVHALR